MPLRRTPHGMSHGDAPAGPAFVVIKLKLGWQLDPDSGAFHAGKTQRLAPALPAGAALMPAMPPARPSRGRPSPAERELARYVHLRLPEGVSVEEGLALARDWPCVERADPPPSISLP